MSVFTDKTYDQMDWISQAVEPYTCDLIEIIAELPEEIVMTSADITSHLHPSSRALNKYGFLARKIFSHDTPYDHREVIASVYSFESSATRYNAKTRELNGTVVLKKSSETPINDKWIKSQMERIVGDHIPYKATNLSIKVISDLGEILLDLTPEFLNACKSQKMVSIRHFLVNSVEKDTLRFRSLEAWNQFLKICSDFLIHGDEKLLGLIYRVVVVAKQGKPIYTLEA